MLIICLLRFTGTGVFVVNQTMLDPASPSRFAERDRGGGQAQRGALSYK